ncbi:Sodium/pantothenate symporter [Ceratocystis lukuohia]|uniref:Sodium/pantothenate symporter n=1 Tax=Ceratocystis lukuohia TaxID=2019550 RepID=A0ABR4M9F0_9PEZI
MATVAGVQGLVIYALSCGIPMLVFAYFGSIIRKQCPDGFVLTEWTRQRYGVIASLYLSFMTLFTLFLYMVSELSAIGQVINTLTGLKGISAVIVECVVTTIYTSLGGFRISFFTDTIQGVMILCLVLMATIAIGTTADIDRSLIDSSGLLDASLLGWQLLYILPMCVITNNFFLSSYWLRTFASKSDKDLWLGAGIASVVVTCVLVLVGMTGIIAVWAGLYADDDAVPSAAFFLLLEQLPTWVIGVVLVLSVAMSTAALDSLQSAMVSSASNDFFRNKLNIWYIRAMVVLVMIPIVVVALKTPSVLQIYLISDLLSSAVVPILVLGLFHRFFFLRGFDIVVGGLGGILTVFIFGCIYYGNSQQGADLLLIEQGLTSGDWGVFGAFVAAPFGGIAWGFMAAGLRMGINYMLAKRNGTRFTDLDRPVSKALAVVGEPLSSSNSPNIAKDTGLTKNVGEIDEHSVAPVNTPAGKFF